MMTRITLVVCLCLAAFACASKESHSSSRAKGQRYVSVDGRFSIDLPDNPTHSEIPAVPGKSGVGHNFAWKTDEGTYAVGYTDWIIEPLDGAEMVQVSSENTVNGALKSGGKLVASNETNFGQYRGIESKLLILNHIFLFRHVSQGNRIYVLSARWPESKDGEVQTKTLDSFKIEN